MRCINIYNPPFFCNNTNIENYDNHARPKVRRAAKDSVFTDLFSDPKNLLELYKTLHPEDTKATVESIKNVTIKPVLTTGVYNDIGFMVGDRLLILAESQATWTTNILIRALLYITNSYHQYLKTTKQDFYHSAKVKLPKPEIYVIYTGKQGNKPKRLSFSQEFFGGEDLDLELKATVIYETKSRDIINQYIIFCNILNEQVKLHGYTKNAIDETLRLCRDKDILKEYLEKRKTEVITMLDSLFDDDEIMEMHDNRIWREATEAAEKNAKKAAKKAAKEAAKETAKRFLAMGCITPEQISEGTGLSIEEIKKLQNTFN